MDSDGKRKRKLLWEIRVQKYIVSPYRNIYIYTYRIILFLYHHNTTNTVR